MSAKIKLPEDVRSDLVTRAATLKTRQEKTREVAYTLFFLHNVFPSAAAVREITDHGSLNDIQADLNQFWGDLRSRNTARMSLPSMPDDVSRGFFELFEKVWELALDRAQKSLNEERAEMENSVARIRLEADEAQRNRIYAEDRRNASIEELQSERAQREEAEKLVATLQADVASLNKSIDGWIVVANDRKHELESRMEKFLEETDEIRKSHARDLEVIEGEKHFAMLQIDNARTQVSELKSQIIAMKADHEIELSAYRQGNNALREKNNEMALGIAELSGKLAALVEQRTPVAQKIKRFQRKR